MMFKACLAPIIIDSLTYTLPYWNDDLSVLVYLLLAGCQTISFLLEPLFTKKLFLFVKFYLSFKTQYYGLCLALV